MVQICNQKFYYFLFEPFPFFPIFDFSISSEGDGVSPNLINVLKFKGKAAKKEVIFITLGSDPPPLGSYKNIFYTRPFFEQFLKRKCFFAPRKAENRA